MKTSSNPSATLNDPFAGLPSVRSFKLTSTDITEGKALPVAQLSGIFGIPGGMDESPQLSWTGAPAETKSYVVALFDPDAPTGSGFWHWVVADIPASVTALASNAGTDQADRLPAEAIPVVNDAGTTRYIGGAPPAGHGTHRYYFVVSALDVETIGVTDSTSPALLGFLMSTHTLARGVLMATATTI